jgi:hypothetical protein
VVRDSSGRAELAGDRVDAALIASALLPGQDDRSLRLAGLDEQSGRMSYERPVGFDAFVQFA